MISTLLHLPRFYPFLRGGHRRPALEHLALRPSLTVYERTAPRPPRRGPDQSVWVWLSGLWTRIVREAPHDLRVTGAIAYEPPGGDPREAVGISRHPPGRGAEPAGHGHFAGVYQMGEV